MKRHILKHKKKYLAGAVGLIGASSGYTFFKGMQFGVGLTNYNKGDTNRYKKLRKNQKQMLNQIKGNPRGR